MDKNNNTVVNSNKNSIMFGVIGLIVGLAIGFYVTNWINRNQNISTDLVESKPNSSVAGQPNSSDPNAQGGMLPDIQIKLDKAKNEPENFVAQMEAGDMYAKIKNFEKAIPFYEAGAKLKPNDFQVNVILANAYFDTRQFETAEKYYTKALEINPSDMNARTDLGITFIERSTPDFDRGIKELLTSLNNDPKHAPTLYYLSVANLRKGDKESSQKYLAQLETASPNSELIGRLKQQMTETKQ